MLLNLGSGPHAVPGWINIDRSPNLLVSRLPTVKRGLLRLGVLNSGHAPDWDSSIVRADIRRLPYPDASVDAIYSSHTLEHLYMADAKQVIREAYRVLRSGGRIRLALPNSLQWANDLIAGNDAAAGLEFNRQLLAHPEARPSFGTRLREFSGGHIHRWQPTAPLVASMMSAAGLCEIHELEFRTGTFPDLDRIETRPESFFLQALKA